MAANSAHGSPLVQPSRLRQTERPGLRYGVSHVQGAAEQLMKWTNKGQNGTTRCAFAWPLWPTRYHLKKPARHSKQLPRRKTCSSLPVRSAGPSQRYPARRRRQSGGLPYSPSEGLASRDHAMTPACLPASPLAVRIARSSVGCSAGPKTGWRSPVSSRSKAVTTISLGAFCWGSKLSDMEAVFPLD